VQVLLSIDLKARVIEAKGWTSCSLLANSALSACAFLSELRPHQQVEIKWLNRMLFCASS
jgi:hypothetical protein